MSNKEKVVAVIGLGYVGLPLAVQAAAKGYTVLGVDVDKQRIRNVNQRVSPFVNDQRFNAAFAQTPAQALRAVAGFGRIGDADTIILCLPTPTKDNVPDLSYIRTTSQQIAKHLRPGQLIVLESTVNPGVTRKVVLPILEKTSNLKAGKGFFLAHCPERVDPGNEEFFVGNLNRVVGGITPACRKRATDFYESVVDAMIVPLGSVEEAEFVKSWENTHRNVMIALANESAMICDTLGMDINNILLGLNSKVAQFGLSLAKPGIGPGGHCIPEDIHYVIQKARRNGRDTRFLDSAADVNNTMPYYAVQRLRDMCESHGDNLADLTVGVIGLSYKENIGDTRRSPAIDAARHLVHKANAVILHDPYASDSTDATLRHCTRAKSLTNVLRASDVIFVATAHREYVETITPELLTRHKVKYVLDGRNCLHKEKIITAGIHYRGIGR